MAAVVVTTVTATSRERSPKNWVKIKAVPRDAASELTEQEKRAAEKRAAEVQHGGTVVYAEAGMEFFAFYNLLHPDGTGRICGAYSFPS